MESILVGLLVILTFILMVINSQWAVKDKLPESVQNAGAVIATGVFLLSAALGWCVYKNNVSSV